MSENANRRVKKAKMKKKIMRKLIGFGGIIDTGLLEMDCDIAILCLRREEK